MSAPIAIGDEVAVRDPRQLSSDWDWYYISARGPWFLTAVEGVAACIVQSPLSHIAITTPLSNLRRTGVTR